MATSREETCPSVGEPMAAGEKPMAVIATTGAGFDSRGR